MAKPHQHLQTNLASTLLGRCPCKREANVLAADIYPKFHPAGPAVRQGGHQLVTVPSDKAPMRFSGHRTVTGESTGAAHVGDFIWKAHHSSLIKETKKHPIRKEERRIWDQDPRDGSSDHC